MLGHCFSHCCSRSANGWCQKWPVWSAPPVSIIYIGSFSLHLQAAVERWRLTWQSDIEFWRTKLESALRNCAHTCFSVQGQKLLHHSLVGWSWGKKVSITRAHIESAGCNIMITQEIWPISKEHKCLQSSQRGRIFKPELVLHWRRQVLNGHLSE